MTQQDFQVQRIKDVYAKKGYNFFENGAYNLNIGGVRSLNRVANSFDDFIYCIFKDNSGAWIVKSWEATTDAGTYWLKNPMNTKGTALLVPNQYIKGWRIGLHQGKYKALVQNKEVSVYRDNNKNEILDFNKATIDKGFFGINIHRSNPSKTSIAVEKWSAGCQVFANPKDFQEFLEICDISARKYGDEFTYTLIEEQDFNV